jgi:hypothetical protein
MRTKDGLCRETFSLVGNKILKKWKRETEYVYVPDGQLKNAAKELPGNAGGFFRYTGGYMAIANVFYMEIFSQETIVCRAKRGPETNKQVSGPFHMAGLK